MDSGIIKTQTMSDKKVVEATILIPTIGRAVLLNQLLDSLRANEFQPDEIIIVDQSGDSESFLNMLDISMLNNVRVIESEGEGIASNLNLGFRLSRNRTVIVTHDDCEVHSNWVGMAYMLHRRYGGLITGNVYPPVSKGVGDVPATRVVEQAADLITLHSYSALYPNNMVLDGEMVLGIGGFDERPAFRTAGEDLDFAYRWLKNENSFRVDPSLKVVHHDWRDKHQLKNLYRRYARAAGSFYCKHISVGEFIVFRWMYRDIKIGLHAWYCFLAKKPSVQNDEKRALVPYMISGFLSELVYEVKLKIAR